MSGQLTCQVDANGDVVAVAPHGVLDAAGAAEIRSAVSKALAEAPLAVVVDVTGLTLADDVCLTVFPALARHAHAEPGTSMAIYGADQSVRSRMSALGIDRHVPVYASRDEAVRRVADRAPQAARVAQRFAPYADSVPQARVVATTACARWRMPRVVSNRVQVIVTELSSNAVVHARTPFELVLRRSPAFVHVAVLDGDERPARLVGPESPYSVGGRGLLLVEAFAAAWGCHPTMRGKSTWASVRYRPLPEASVSP
jgi:anti-anti-sigma factor